MLERSIAQVITSYKGGNVCLHYVRERDPCEAAERNRQLKSSLDARSYRLGRSGAELSMASSYWVLFTVL